MHPFFRALKRIFFEPLWSASEEPVHCAPEEPAPEQETEEVQERIEIFRGLAGANLIHVGKPLIVQIQEDLMSDDGSVWRRAYWSRWHHYHDFLNLERERMLPWLWERLRSAEATHEAEGIARYLVSIALCRDSTGKEKVDALLSKRGTLRSAILSELDSSARAGGTIPFDTALLEAILLEPDSEDRRTALEVARGYGLHKRWPDTDGPMRNIWREVSRIVDSETVRHSPPRAPEEGLEQIWQSRRLSLETLLEDLRIAGIAPRLLAPALEKVRRSDGYLLRYLWEDANYASKLLEEVGVAHWFFTHHDYRLHDYVSLIREFVRISQGKLQIDSLEQWGLAPETEEDDRVYAVELKVGDLTCVLRPEDRARLVDKETLMNGMNRLLETLQIRERYIEIEWDSSYYSVVVFADEGAFAPIKAKYFWD